jgi:hypothetical protein
MEQHNRILADVELLAHSMELDELQQYRDALGTGFIGYQKASLIMQTNTPGIKPVTIESQVDNMQHFFDYYGLYSKAWLLKNRMRGKG